MAEKEEQGVGIRRPGTLRRFWEFPEDMESFWEGFPRFPRFRRLLEPPSWPAVDVFDRDGSVVVKADIPGMTAEDIEVNVTEDGITIAGERTEEKEVKEKDYYRSERSYGRFMRQVPLPAGADREKAEATFKDGVLEITLPLKEEAKQKKIEIKSS